MIRRSSEPLRAWFLAWDVAVTAAAWVVADLVRLRTGLIPITAPDYPPFEACLAQLPVVVLLALVSYRVVRMYDVTRLRRFREEMVAVGKGVALLGLLVVLVTFAMQSPYRSRVVLGIFTGLTAVGVLLTRRLSWSVLGRLRSHGYNQSHALVVGTGRLARRTARALADSSWMGIRSVAYVEDDPTDKLCDLPVLGPIDLLPELVERHHIEHVFIALPLARYPDARRVFDVLSQSIVEVRLVADVPAMSGLSLTTTNLQGMTVIGLRESGHYGLNVVIKRLMDVVLALVGLVVLSPLMAAIAVIVKLTSPGPVFYRQERCSMNGQTFQMLKFRSMRVDSEKDGPRMTAANDPRCTRFGKFLRETNLDELPQLFNVLWGDMSLVGPRPERPVFVNRFRKTIPNYMARHAVKCGITGWAQVNGWRGNSSLRRRVQYDLYYITHWNPLFDLRILVLTVVHMLFRRQRHAY
jgi:Undecaprenyl-phosphate glucose phosphotransferase